MLWHHADLASSDRAAWDEDDWDEGVEHCLSHILPAGGVGPVLDIGCGPARLLAPMITLFPMVEFIGLDVSEAMLDHARTRVDVELIHGSVEDVPAELGGAYSVVTFQHLPVDLQVEYVVAVGAALTPSGTFVLQWVADGDSGPLSNPVPVPRMIEWVSAAGLTVEVGKDSRFPTWAWAVATKS